MSQLQEFKKHLHPGEIYRRADLLQCSNAVDRHLRQLQKDGTLTKLSAGLYYCPKPTVFGVAPAEDVKLVEAFLKDKRFLLNSPNTYNALGLGAPQLYNETAVYNHKRHGRFPLGGRVFDFRVKPHFPKALSQEFLLVDLVNNLDQLAENVDTLLKQVGDKSKKLDSPTFRGAVRNYGSLRTRKFFAWVLGGPTLTRAF